MGHGTAHSRGDSDDFDSIDGETSAVIQFRNDSITRVVVFYRPEAR